MERDIKPEGLDASTPGAPRRVEHGQEEIEIMRFPAHFCTDHGRAINNFEADWPDSLTGFAPRPTTHLTTSRAARLQDPRRGPGLS